MCRFTRFRPRFARFHPRLVDSRGLALHFYCTRIVARFHLRFVKFHSRFVDSRGSILDIVDCREVPPSIRGVPSSVRRFMMFCFTFCEVPPSIRREVPPSIREVPSSVRRFAGCFVLHSARFRSRFVARLRPRFARFHPQFARVSTSLGAEAFLDEVCDRFS